MTKQKWLPCGHLDLGDSWHGGRPFQCIHQWEAWQKAKRQPEQLKMWP